MSRKLRNEYKVTFNVKAIVVQLNFNFFEVPWIASILSSNSS